MTPVSISVLNRHGAYVISAATSFVYWVRGRWHVRLLLSISVYASGLFEATRREDEKLEATYARRVREFSNHFFRQGRQARLLL